MTRFDVVCQPTVVPTTLEMIRSWADDRVLPDIARDRLTALVRAAMAHGLRFDPRAVTVRVGWLDASRIRLDLRWNGCAPSARPAPAAERVEDTMAVLDTLARGWGVGRARDGWVLWMVVDAD